MRSGSESTICARGWNPEKMPAERFLPYGRQSVDESDIAAVVDVLRSDWLTTGPAVEAFETAFAEQVEADAAVTCANGTAALHLAAMALGLGPDDVVIVPAITFLATANAARYVGAEVIFADVDPETGLMMPDHLEEALSRAPTDRTKAVFPVHLNGQVGDPAEMCALARRHGLHIVEDACHALGSRYVSDGMQYTVGGCAHADLATFSFHPVKAIATGEGGMVSGNDPDLVSRVKVLRSHGMTREPGAFRNVGLAFDGAEPNPWYYEMSEPGYNYRLSDIQCALGLSQLRRLEAIERERSARVQHYLDRLKPLDPTVKPVAHNPGCAANWHLFVVLIGFEDLGISRRRLMTQLAERGVGSQVHYIPLYRQPYYEERYGLRLLSGAENYYARCLSLPLFPDMSMDDVDHVCDALADIAGAES